MHGQRHRSHATACRFLRECDSDTQGCRSGEGQEDENLGEGDFAREARNCSGRLRKVSRDLVCTSAHQMKRPPDKRDRIPLERGQELAQRYGVAPLLSPLFDFVPTTSTGNSMPSMSSQTQSSQTAPTSRPLSASSSFSNMGATNSYGPGSLGPAPIMPGSAMRLLSQGRAQGLFTPSTSTAPTRQNTFTSATAAYNSTGYNASSPYVPVVLSPTPSTSSQQLKRTRSDMEGDSATPRTIATSQPTRQQSSQTNSTSENNIPRPSSSTPVLNGDDNLPPAKRSRKEHAATNSVDGQDASPTRPGSRNSITMEGLSCPGAL